jgi:thiol-disulfide isomerase/thioredoxin
MLCRRVFAALCFGLLLSSATAWCDERSSSAAIVALVQANKLDEAEKSFQEALKEYPDSAAIQRLRSLLFTANKRAEKHAEALAHLDAYIEFQLSLAAKGQPAGTFARLWDDLAAALTSAGKGDAVRARLDALIEKVEGASEKNTTPFARADLAALRGRRVMLLASGDERDKARGRAMFDQLLKDAQRMHELDQDDAAAALVLSETLNLKAQLAALTSADDARKDKAAQLEFLAAQAKRAPGLEVLNAYVGAVTLHARDNMDADPELAAKQLDEAAALCKSVGDNPDASAAAKQAATRSIATIATTRRRLDSAIVQKALIGQPSIPLDVEAWVNGGPLAPEDIKGKVVLLDFWAVWCGPCIATFPHLREWNEKYSDKGLVIVGVTRHYKYGWNDEAKKIQKIDDIKPADEQAAMVKFAEHHQLKHRFVVTPAESEFWKHYGVTGIPHVVLIDRDGKVRLIRVGSGEANAKALHEMIEKLIETPAAGSGG